MSRINQLPVLILAYNRFDKFLRCINTLNNYGVKKIFVSIDGPVSKSDIKIQKKILSFCFQKQNDLDIKINLLGQNNGCRLGPLKGISWFFDQNEYGVIMEDDVLVSESCMHAFLRLLKNEIQNKNYMSISSFNEFTNKGKEAVYSLPVWRSWGWATWSDRWKNHLEFSQKIKGYSMWKLYKLLPPNFRSIETVKLIKASQLNLLDAWDYEFNFSHIVNKKTSLTIGGINNYVYGFDNSGTHTHDIDLIAIDFNLFCEREINTKQIIIVDYKKYIKTIEKCGYAFSDKKTFNNKNLNFFKTIIFSFVFHLKKIKRIMYKSL